MWIYLNDRFVKEEEAVVSVFDHGFLYGDGVYETIRSYGSRICGRDRPDYPDPRAQVAGAPP
jgi:branched-chain amino acid aminotransferase